MLITLIFRSASFSLFDTLHAISTSEPEAIIVASYSLKLVISYAPFLTKFILRFEILIGRSCLVKTKIVGPLFFIATSHDSIVSIISHGLNMIDLELFLN